LQQFHGISQLFSPKLLKAALPFYSLAVFERIFFNTTDVGILSAECRRCGALKFPVETESLCSVKGNNQLEPCPRPQPFLEHLYEGIDSDGILNIRKYNSTFQMTSFGCNEITIPGFNLL